MPARLTSSGGHSESLLIAIGHSDVAPWSAIAREGQGSTWLGTPDLEDVKTLYFTGHAPGKSLRRLDRWHEELRWSRRLGGVPSRSLRVLDAVGSAPIQWWIPPYRIKTHGTLPRPCLESAVLDCYLTIPSKELSLFDYFLRQSNADWLYVTTSSSYVRPNKVLEVARSLGQDKVYAGSMIVAGKHRFASGANRIFSRDVVEIIVRKRQAWDRSVLEDLGLGKMLHRQGIALCAIPTLNLDSVEAIDSASNEELDITHHFRLKSGGLMSRNDVTLMRHLHQRLAEAQIDV